MSRKGTAVRIADKTNTALTMVSGLLQAETGNKFSANDTIWHLIEKYHPDIAQKATEIDDKSDDQPNQ